MYDQFLHIIYARDINNISEIQTALDTVANKVFTIDVKGIGNQRLLFFKLENNNELSIYFKFFDGLQVTRGGLQTTSITISQDAWNKVPRVEIGKITLDKGIVELIGKVSSELKYSFFEQEKNILHLLRSELQKTLNSAVSYIAPTDITKEFYKDKNDQYRSTQYGYLLKSIFIKIRSAIVAFMRREVAKDFSESNLPDFNMKNTQKTVAEQIDLLATKYFESEDFNNRFNDFIFTLYKIQQKDVDLNKIILDNLDYYLVSNEQLKQFIKEYKDYVKTINKYTIPENSSIYDAGIAYITSILKAIDDSLVLYVASNSVNASLHQESLYRKVFAIGFDPEKLKQEKEIADKTSEILKILPKNLKDRLTKLYNRTQYKIEEAETPINEAESDEDNKSKEDKYSDKNIEDSDDMIEGLSEEAQNAISEFIEQGNLVYSIETNSYITKDNREINDTQFVNKINNMIEDEIFSNDKYDDILDKDGLINKLKLTEEVFEKYKKQYGKSEKLNIRNFGTSIKKALSDENSYQSFREDNSTLERELRNFNKYTEDLFKKYRVKQKSGKEVIKLLGDYIKTSLHMPQDLLDKLISPFKGYTDITAALAQFKAILIIYIGIAKIFADEKDHQVARKKITSLLNLGFNTDKYYNMLAPKKVSPDETKSLVPGQQLDLLKTNIFRNQLQSIIKELDGSLDTESDINFIKAIQDFADKLNDISQNIQDIANAI